MAFDWDPMRFTGFDFETSGSLPENALQPWHYATGKFWVTSLAAIKTIGPGMFRPFGDLFPSRIQVAEMLIQAIIDKQTMVGWNVIFDISICLAMGFKDLVFQLRWLDGMLLWKHAKVEPEYDLDRWNKKSYALDECIMEQYPYEPHYWEGIDYHSTDPESLAKLHSYNKKDTVYTLLLARHWWEQLSEQQRQVALIEAECLPFVAAANLEGFPVDTLVASDLADAFLHQAAEQQEMLAPLGMTLEIMRSPKQLGNLLYDVWGLTPLKKSAAGNRSVDKETLHELAVAGDPRAKMLRNYREALNQKTKFADAPLESARYNGDGRTRPSAFVFSTYTGRLTYASKQGKNKAARQIGFAIHQEKREPEFRAILVPPPECDLVEFDAAGQEFKWMAVASGDQTMLSLCLPGEDPHAFMGAKIGRCDYRWLIAQVELKDRAAETLRKSGKVGNFSLQYRTSPPKFCATARVDYEMDISLDEAKYIHRVYLATYEQVPVYWSKQQSKGKRLGYAETFAGRRVEVMGDWGKDGWRLGSTMINYPVQGTGADQKYLAIAVIRDIVIKYDAHFALDMHDGLYFFVPKRNTQRFCAEGKHLLDNLPYKRAWGYEPPIPMPFDCKVGPSWGNMGKWKGAS